MRSWTLVLLLVGCPGKSDVSTGLPTATGAATAANPGPAPGTTGGTGTDHPCWGITLWTDDGATDTLDLCILDPLGVTDWDFGMVTAAWTGEDCLHGAGAIAVCHAVHAPYHTLTQVADPADVVSGSTTLFDASSDPELTYYLADTSACFVWGADPAYYASLGCDALR